MNVIVDTSVWSEAFRKRVKPATPLIVHELQEIIKEGRVVLLGVIRQELLSGIRNHAQFTHLKEQMGAFPDYPVSSEDHELAAELFNRCRAVGVQGSNTDFLICASAIRAGLSIFTTDKDFNLFSKHFKMRLHHARF